MFPLDQEMEEQEHLTKALVILCQERGHPDTLVTPEGRDEIGTARCHWERSFLEKPLGAMRDLAVPCRLSSLCIAFSHSSREGSAEGAQQKDLLQLLLVHHALASSHVQSLQVQAWRERHPPTLDFWSRVFIPGCFTPSYPAHIFMEFFLREKTSWCKTSLRQGKADFFTWRTQGGSKTALLPRF